MKHWRIKDYPPHVRVKDAIYRVLFVRRIPGDSSRALAGCCCRSTRTIWIALGQTPAERASTFMHEVLHAVDFEYGLNLSHRHIYRLERPLAELTATLILHGVTTSACRSPVGNS